MGVTCTALATIIVIFSEVFSRTVLAKQNTSTNTNQSDVVCIERDLLVLAQRMSSLEAAFKVQNEDRQQILHYFSVFTDVLSRLIRIENETDDMMKTLHELRIKSDVITNNVEEMNRTVQSIGKYHRNMTLELNRRADLHAKANELKIMQVVEKVVQIQKVHEKEIGRRIDNIENQVSNVNRYTEPGVHEDRNITMSFLLDSIQQTQTLCRDNYTAMMSRYASLESNIPVLNQSLYQSIRMVNTIQNNVSFLMNGLISKTAFCAVMLKKGFVGNRIIYNQVLLNEGFAYNNNTGIFTSRSSGLFVFSWVTEVFNNQRKNSYLTVNGKQMFVVYSFAEPNTYTDVTGVGVVRLSVGDQVYITVSSTYGIDTHQTTFCGWGI